MHPWEIGEGRRLPKALKHLKGNAPVLRNYARLVERLKSCSDPSALGERKRGDYKRCHGVHLTKSISVIYSVDYASRTVWILDIGDNKWLYGRDNRP